MTQPNKMARWAVVVGMLASLGAGCGERAPAPVTVQLQESFQGADAQEQVHQATQALARKDYVGALATMNQLVHTRSVDEAQKQALDNLIIEARRAAEKNPELNTPELYQVTTELFFRLHPEN